MSRLVRKYTLDLKDGLDHILEIPGGGTFLYIKDQVYDKYGLMNDPTRENRFDTWWAIDTDNVPVEVQLHFRATEAEVPPSVVYLGTVFPFPTLTLHLWQKDRVFQDMHIVDGKFVPKS